mgnify:FL=1
MADKKQEIILGLGKFSIYDGETKVPIAYTRGGGAFTVERVYRPITFDGLKAYASQDMIVIDEENVNMEINMLSIFTDADLTFLYPAMKHSSDAQGIEITSNDDLAIKTEDYRKVEWEGITNTGKPVVITIENAVNVSNVDWKMTDRDEVLQTISYKGIAPKGEVRVKYSIKWPTASV